MYIILLSGGSGRRLWPLSNDLCSKQYIKLIEPDKEIKAQEQVKCSMLQRVYGQLKELNLDEKTIIAASSSQVEIIQSQLMSKADIAVEPERRDTFPAILLACSYLKSMKGASDDDFVTVLPVDPYTELSFFQLILELQEVLKETKKDIGLLGASPTYPSQKYGYIVPTHTSSESNEVHSYMDVSGFKEKPDELTAEKLMKEGAVWNCGVFCFRIGLLQKYIEKYAFDYTYESIRENYGSLPKISFDYEVLEQSDSIVALTYHGIWKDLGTWNTLTEEMADKVVGQVELDETSDNCNVINVLDIPIVVMGAKDMVVAASHDGILVADKHQSSYLKKCLDRIPLESKFEERRWGTIKTIDTNECDHVKTITNKIKMQDDMFTTYHLHEFHDEYITILSGEGIIIYEGEEYTVKQGDSYHLYANHLHAIKAIHDLRYMEILMGTKVNDDIVRKIYEWDEIKSEMKSE